MKKCNYILAALLLSLSVLNWAGATNINTATSAEIASSLKGIGETKADAIVEYRDENGAFKSADDLTLVKGIGVSTVDKNRANISIE